MQLKPKQPDTYDGKRDFQTIDNWVASVDSYFALTKAKPPEIYHYLNTIFTGNAATWFRFHHRNLDPATITWNSVKTALLAYFIPPNHTRRLRDEWAYTRQTATVSEYYTRLTQLAMQLGDITESIFVDKFIRGLKSKTKTEVELHDPQTLAEAVRLADRYDTIAYRRTHFVPSQSPYPDTCGQPMSPSFVPQPQQSFQEDTRGEPMQLDTLRMNHDDTSTTVQIGVFRIKAQPLKKLTSEERAHLRSTYSCFKCRKQGHLARDCPTKTCHPNSKKPGSPVDVDIPAGRRPLEMAPTIPVKTPVVMATPETNGEMDEPNNYVDEPVNLEEPDTLNEEPNVSNERTPVKPTNPVTPSTLYVEEPSTLYGEEPSTQSVKEPVTTPVMASTPDPVDNLDDNLVIPRHPDPRVKFEYPGIHDTPENIKTPVVYGKIDGRIAQIMLDSGCSTYVLSTDFANAGNIPYFACKPVPVEFAVRNASQFTLDTQTKRLPMEVGNITLSKALYVSPLSNCDAIFGMPFLNGRKLATYPDKPVVSLDDMEFPIVKDPDKIHPAVQDRTDPEYLNRSKRI
jgi:hypothetical protein